MKRFFGVLVASLFLASAAFAASDMKEEKSKGEVKKEAAKSKGKGDVKKVEAKSKGKGDVKKEEAKSKTEEKKAAK